MRETQHKIQDTRDERRRWKGGRGFSPFFFVFRLSYFVSLFFLFPYRVFSDDYAVFPATPQNIPSASAPVLIQWGLEAERKGDSATALSLYLKAASLAPDNAKARDGIARTKLELRRRTQKTNEQMAEERRREAWLSRERKKSQEESLKARCRQGRGFLIKGKVFQAADVFHRVLEEFPAYEPARRGILKTQKGLAAKLKKGRFPSPQHQAATQAMFLYNQGEWEKAARAFDEMDRAGPLAPELAEARLGLYAAAARVKERERKWKAERDVLMDQARERQKTGRLTEAQTLLQTILKKDPADSEARTALEAVNALRENGRQQKAQKEIDQRMAAGRVHSSQGRYTEAMEEFLHVLELDPQHTKAQQQLGKVQQAMKKQGIYVPVIRAQDQAENYYKEGLRLYGEERYDEAAKAFQAALKLTPDHQEAHEALQRLKEQKK
jgi:tetratricopeptide (TPR) repeat protein